MNEIEDPQRARRVHWDRIQHQAQQIHDLTQRLAWIERLLEVESERPTVVGNAYTSPEGWAEKQKAAEAKCCGHDSQWRDVKTDPPKVSGQYLIAVYGYIATAGYRRGLRTWRSSAGTIFNDDSVTHWQELPKPPQATEPA